MTAWHQSQQPELAAAIAEFKSALPGWWYSLGECQVSADASCGPTPESEHIALIAKDARFDSGFHVDLPQPATLAEALRVVMAEALEAVAMFDHWLSPPCESSGLTNLDKMKDALGALKGCGEQEEPTPILLTPSQYSAFEAAGVSMENYRIYEMPADPPKGQS